MQGALRKWYFPSLGTPLLLFQYLLVFYVHLVAKLKRTPNMPMFTPAFQGILFAYIFYGFMEAFNISGTENIIVQTYGLVMHFSFIPFLYLISKIMENEDTFEHYLTWLNYIIIPLFLLGITQFFSPRDAFINKYATTEEIETAVGSGGRARITGTFSYFTVYGSFLGFILHFFLFQVINSLFRGKLNVVALVTYGLGFINLFMTGSRGAVVIYFLAEFLVLLYLAITGEVKFLKSLIPLSVILFVGFLVVMSTDAGSTAINDFLDRLFGLNDMDARLDDGFDPFKFANYAGFFGLGIGTAQFPMEIYLTNRDAFPGFWEDEGERIVLEFGALGYVLVMMLRWSIVVSCFVIVKKIKRLEYKILALQMTFFQSPFLINISTNIFNYVDGIFYWMAVGFVYFAYNLDRMKDKELEAKRVREEILRQT
jgi:hypothetical protein